MSLADALSRAEAERRAAAHSDPAEQVATIRAAIQLYYSALDRREHGGIAQDNAFKSIERALGMEWRQREARSSPNVFTLSAGAIRAIRLRLTITQEQLASMLGVSPTKVNRWETEKEACRGIVAERLAQLEGRVKG